MMKETVSEMSDKIIPDACAVFCTFFLMIRIITALIWGAGQAQFNILPF